jgi:hypothetical protein
MAYFIACGLQGLPGITGDIPVAAVLNGEPIPVAVIVLVLIGFGAI